MTSEDVHVIIPFVKLVACILFPGAKKNSSRFIGRIRISPTVVDVGTTDYLYKINLKFSENWSGYE